MISFIVIYVYICDNDMMFVCYPQGVGPTAQRAAVIAGVLLPTYDLVKHHILHTGIMEDTKELHFL